MQYQSFNKKMIPTLLAVGLGFGLQQTATYAQSNSSVSVSGKGSQMDPVIVTATRTPTLANDVLADDVYIGPEEIAEAGQSTITQLLQRQRGVEVSASGGGVQTVFLRGWPSGITSVPMPSPAITAMVCCVISRPCR